MYRLSNSSRTVEFFRSNTIDFVGFGFSKLKQGSHIGLPASYFATNRQEIENLMPPNGFENFLGTQIKRADIDAKLDESTRDTFYKCLLLSDEAKVFGVCRELIEAENLFLSNFDKFLDFVIMSGAYLYSYLYSRRNKLQYTQRKRLYVTVGMLALVAMLASRLLTQILVDYNADVKACRLGLDACEGSIEYYDKLLERNKILRQLIDGGERLIDPNGNYLVKIIYIPTFSSYYYFYVQNLNSTLTERRDKCKKELVKMIAELSLANEKKKEASEKQRNDQQDDNKEWPIFKKLRIMLESRLK